MKGLELIEAKKRGEDKKKGILLKWKEWHAPQYLFGYMDLIDKASNVVSLFGRSGQRDLNLSSGSEDSTANLKGIKAFSLF